MLPDNCTVLPAPRASAIKPYCLSHGTLECASLEASRRFYEDFLGLEVARHGPSSMVLRLGMRFHVVCVEVGANVHPAHLLNHWGVDVMTRAEVDDAYAAALRLKAEYGMLQVLPPKDMHGVYSFYLEDLDHNWWEVEWYENGFVHDDMFDFGDRFGARKRPSIAEAEEARAEIEAAQLHA